MSLIFQGFYYIFGEISIIMTIRKKLWVKKKKKKKLRYISKYETGIIILFFDEKMLHISESRIE